MPQLRAQRGPVEAEEFGGRRAIAAGVGEHLAQQRVLQRRAGAVMEVGLGAVAEQEQARAFEAWLTGVEKRAGLEWKRPPQPR